MKCLVIGCGRWGSFIAWYLNSIGHDVTVYGRIGSENFSRLKETGKSGPLTFPESIKFTSDIKEIYSVDAVFISIGSQGLSSLMDSIAAIEPEGKTYVLCMKGIEIDTGRRLSEICESKIDAYSSVAVWLGPGHVEDFALGRPNCMVIDSARASVKEMLISELTGPLIRFYSGTDLVGNEIGAAAKNVIGIAAGILDGLSMPSLKGALMARAPREISRLISALGGDPVSAYGLCHLGDYEATLFSLHSHNRAYGESLVTGEEFSSLAEGYYTVRALVALGEKYKVELPICTAVYNVIYKSHSPKDEIQALFSRSLKAEF